MTKTIKTNIGEMPIEDYLDIKASQMGFDDYEDMLAQGFTLELGDDANASIQG